MIVQGGLLTGISYIAYDRASGLFVAAKIYDVTTGTPSLVQTVPLPYVANGLYSGSFTPLAGHNYLVISLAFTSNSYVTPDGTRAPNAINIDAPVADTSIINFNYAFYDQNSGDTVEATIYDVNDDTSSTQAMLYVAYGVFYGRYVGTVGKTYNISTVPSDTTDYSPSGDSFQCFYLGGATVTNIFQTATLFGQDSPRFLSEGAPISFTQGDTAVLALVAEDGNGNRVNLTGATFQTSIKGANGVVAVFGNSQHMIVNAAEGLFNLELSEGDTAECGEGEFKTILTQITQGSSVLTFRGDGILTVFTPTPLQ